MAGDDIVTRLRGHIAITTRVHYAKDGFPEPVYVHGPSPICQEAADEIERLREELTASHESHGNEVGALTERLSLAIHERDEARRMLCLEWTEHGPVRLTKEQIAMRYGWDCFKEAADER